MPRYISFENFLRELKTIEIDHLDLILKDQNGVNISQNNIGSLYNQILSFSSLKYIMNLVTINRKNERFILSVGDATYTFYGEMFLRNIGHVRIKDLQNLVISNNLSISQILYLIVNIERVIFNN